MTTKIQDVPAEVLWVWSIQVTTNAVGWETYQAIEDIISRYPEYFEWDYKYDAIPKEVHTAYRDERNAKGAAHWRDFYKEANDAGFIGLIPATKYIADKNEIKAKEFTPQKVYLAELMKHLFDLEEKNRAIEKQIEEDKEALWDKYYKKYDLPLRRNMYGKIIS